MIDLKTNTKVANNLITINTQLKTWEAGADPGFLKAGGGVKIRSTSKKGGPDGGPILGPMLKSLHRGTKGGRPDHRAKNTWTPPPPHTHTHTPLDTPMGSIARGQPLSDPEPGNIHEEEEVSVLVQAFYSRWQHIVGTGILSHL